MPGDQLHQRRVGREVPGSDDHGAGVHGIAIEVADDAPCRPAQGDPSREVHAALVASVSHVPQTLSRRDPGEREGGGLDPRTDDRAEIADGGELGADK